MADWSREENEATVASYFTMLEASLRGEAINKAQSNRQLRQLLNGRTHGAVEFKHQNISAILIDLGVPYISGYKPAINYQRSLRDVVLEQLAQRRVLREVITQSVLDVPVVSDALGLIDVFVDVPPPLARRSSHSPPAPRIRPPVDWVQMEARNSALGFKGERWVVDLERERLERAGKSRLAAQVAHVSVDQGDGLGYDVLSFHEDSREMLIEVKTTKYGEYTPFYVSRNELEVSQQEAASYHLYRVYSFGSHARVFRKSGALDENFNVSPASYLARVS